MGSSGADGSAQRCQEGHGGHGCMWTVPAWRLDHVCGQGKTQRREVWGGLVGGGLVGGGPGRKGEPSPPALRAGTSPPSQLLSLLPPLQEEAGLVKCGGDMGGLWQWWGYAGEQGGSRCHRYPAPWCPHPPAPPQPLSTDVPGPPLSPQQPWHHGVAPRHLETPASAESLHRQAHRDPAPDSVLPLAAWWPPLHPCHFP